MKQCGLHWNKAPITHFARSLFGNLVADSNQLFLPVDIFPPQDLVLGVFSDQFTAPKRPTPASARCRRGRRPNRERNARFSISLYRVILDSPSNSKMKPVWISFCISSQILFVGSQPFAPFSERRCIRHLHIARETMNQNKALAFGRCVAAYYLTENFSRTWA